MPPAHTIANEGPVYDRPYARPEWQDALQEFQGVEKQDLTVALKKLVASPALCSRDFITEQYDRYVRGNTVQSHHANAGVLRIDEETGRGVAVSADASGRYTKLDPNMGARLALAEAYRNVAVTGARPVAITNCLNYGSPENPDVMWQFRESVHGLADGAVELGIPVSGGNVSFYNQTGEEPILPTPVVGVLGVIDDVHKTIGNELGHVDEPEVLVLLGETKDEFGGSIWQQVSADEANTDSGLNGLPPQVDLANEKRLADFFVGNEGITAAHDISEGGLAVTAFEMAKRSGVGLSLDLSKVHEDAFVAAFSESASRVLVATTADRVDTLLHRAEECGVSAVVVGQTTDNGELELGGESIAVSELREAWAATLPDLFGHAVGANSVVE